MLKINKKINTGEMTYKEGYLENGELKFRNEKEIDQSTLTSDCWLIQFKGLEVCNTCEFKNTDKCFGGQTLKKLKNKEFKVNFTINYTISEKDIKEHLSDDNFDDEDITEEILVCEAEKICRAWLDEAIDEGLIDSSEEYFSCEILNN